MKKMIGVLTVLLICAMVFAVYIGFQVRNEQMKNEETSTGTETGTVNEEDNIEWWDDDVKSTNEDYIEIMSRDIATDYPTSYLDLMEYYNKMVVYMYSGQATEEEIKNLVDRERAIYSQEILLMNTYEEQLAYAIEDVESFTQDENKIMSSEILEVFETNLENDMVEIRVLYRVTKTGNSDMQYYLIKENGLWKIHSFRATLVEEE